MRRRMMLLMCLSAAALLPTAAAAQPAAPAGDAEQAQLAFNNHCRTCHTTKEGDNRLGPSLYRVVGRKAGTLPGFGYTDAMAHSDLTWDKPTLDRFLANPDQVVPGNRMKPFGGVASAEERARIITFLEAAR